MGNRNIFQRIEFNDFILNNRESVKAYFKTVLTILSGQSPEMKSLEDFETVFSFSSNNVNFKLTKKGKVFILENIDEETSKEAKFAKSYLPYMQEALDEFVVSNFES